MPSPRKLDLQSFLGSSVTEPIALVERRAPSPVRLATAAIGCPAKRNSATANSGFAIVLVVLLYGLMASSPGSLFAQSSSAGQNPSQPEGVTSGGYLIHSSIDVGYRSNDLTGSGDMYDTLVNQHTGPRFLDQTLSMQSLDHQGLLFDDLYINSFGWGGDPNNALRLRADKNKWYNLVGSFRRDQSFSDFDLLANPLNPPTSNPSIPALNSPHLFDTTRRMSDLDLTLLPQSRLSFRLGFSRNNMTGPSYSSVHEGTDALLLQDWNTTMNSYRFGVDWKAAPRTVISYDQFFNYYKGDTDYQLAPFAPALLSNGNPVELGLSIDTANNVPCKPPTSAGLIVGGVLQNNTCSAYFSYSRNQRIRTNTPTERLSLRSNNIQRLDLVASYSYSSADMNTPLDENFRRSDHAYQHPSLQRHRHSQCKPNFQPARCRGYVALDPTSAPDREIVSLGLPYSGERQPHRVRLQLCDATMHAAQYPAHYPNHPGGNAHHCPVVV